MKKRSGFTIVELLIATGLMAIVAYFASRLFINANKGMNDTISRFGTMSTLNIVGGNLQKYLATGDTRFNAFSGNASDSITARMFLPLPGYCADLDTTKCTEDTAFLYIHYDKTIVPSVSPVCLLHPNSDTDTGFPTLLIDLYNESYGPATFTGTGFNVTSGAALSPYPTGPMPIGVNTLFGIMNAPLVNLYVAQAAPTAYDPGYNSSTNTFNAEFTAACNPTFLTKDGVGNYRTDRLYAVTLRPFKLTPFTGGTAVSTPDFRSVMGSFPSRLFVATLRSLGKGFDQGGKPMITVNNCNVTHDSVTCPNNSVFVVPGVERIRLDESFKFALVDSAGTAYTTTSRYEILKPSPSMTASLSCQNPECRTMTMASPTAIPVIYGGTETFQNLRGDNFSMLKQNALARLRFRAQLKQKEESFDVVFP